MKVRHDAARRPGAPRAGRALRDERGFFLESYRASALADHGITRYVRPGQQLSVLDARRAARRALPRSRPAMAKLVRVGRGAIFDVACRPPAGLGHVRRLGGLRARRRGQAHPLRADRVRARVSGAVGRRRRARTSARRTTTPRASERSPTTTRPSASAGRCAAAAVSARDAAGAALADLAARRACDASALSAAT